MATTTHKGKGYCKQHNPENVDARDKASREKLEAKLAVDREQCRRERVIRKFVGDVPTDTLKILNESGGLWGLIQRATLALATTGGGEGS